MRQSVGSGPPPMMVGWMEKESRKGTFGKNWKRRWFVLVLGELKYYENPLDEAPFGETLKGEVELTNGTVTSVDESEFKFVICGLKKRDVE